MESTWSEVDVGRLQVADALMVAQVDASKNLAESVAF